MKVSNHIIPALSWACEYNTKSLSNDLVAATIVTIMLIPQSLGYALLAGLPPEAGIYASIVPVILYSVFGSSNSLAVGPVAIISLLTASSLSQVALQGTAGYTVAALTLAALSGLFLTILGVLRLGFFVNFLSHPVITGFITASGTLIAISQLTHILGVDAEGRTLTEVIISLSIQASDTNLITFAIGLMSALFLLWVRRDLGRYLKKAGIGSGYVRFLTQAGPIFIIIATTMAVWLLELEKQDVKVVGNVPQGLPPFTLPSFSMDLVKELVVPSILISIIGFVESVSVAQTLAARKQQRINPDQELIGLGVANIGAAFTGGYPVTGGFARSVVNFDAGAETPAAGAFTAIGLVFAAIVLTPLIYYLPKATLAATIIVAVLSLVDFSILRRTWIYSKADFAAVITTIITTLGLGVEAGVSFGILLSIFIHLYRTSAPHVAEVGLVPGTQHFRNILRHKVQIIPGLLSLRVDESLYFANARYLEDWIQKRVVEDKNLKHVVLMCSAINSIDFSALQSLEVINTMLKNKGIGFHLSEVKGPVMDRLESTSFIKELNGNVFLSQYNSWESLSR